MDNRAHRPQLCGKLEMGRANRRLTLRLHLHRLQGRQVCGSLWQRPDIGDPFPPRRQPRQVRLHPRSQPPQRQQRRRLPGRHELCGGELPQQPHQRDGRHDCQRRESRQNATWRKVRLERRVEPPFRRPQRQRLHRRPPTDPRPQQGVHLPPRLSSRLPQRKPVALRDGPFQLHHLHRAQFRHSNRGCRRHPLDGSVGIPQFRRGPPICLRGARQRQRDETEEESPHHHHQPRQP